MTRLHERTSKKPEPLTKEQRELVHSKPTANAGAGWGDKWGSGPLDTDDEPRRHQ